LDKFSLKECRSKFPVAADASGTIMKITTRCRPAVRSTLARTSYVHLAEGQVLTPYTANDPTHHVEYTMAAVQKYVTEHKH